MSREFGAAAVEGLGDVPISRRRVGESRLRWWRRPMVATTILVAALAGWQMFGAWHANSVISSPLRIAIENEQRSGIVVTLSVDPERFHSEYFRENGSVALVEGRRVFMRAVQPDAIRRIGSEYWIVEVDLWEES